MQIPWEGHFKSGKSSVLQARNWSFVRRGFRRKVPFFLSSTKLPEFVQDITLDTLAPHCSIQVHPVLLKSCLQSLCVCNCQELGFHQSHCLSKVCVPAKEELLAVGFLPKCFTHSPQLCHLRRFSGTCYLEAPFPNFATISMASCFGSNALEYAGSHDLTNAILRRLASARENFQLSRCNHNLFGSSFTSSKNAEMDQVVVWVSGLRMASLPVQDDVCVEVQKNVQQHSMTYVWKCKGTSSSVA